MDLMARSHAVVAALAATAGALVAAPAAAEPIIGTHLQLGQSLAGEADARLGSAVHVVQPVGGGWLLGGELAGSIEGYTGGYGCGTIEAGGDVAVPSVAVGCVQPGLAAHLLAGVQAAPSAASTLRLEAGLGATSIFLLATSGTDGRRDTAPSALLRASYLLRATTTLGASWWIGLSLEERALDLADPHLARSVGLLLEGRPL